MSTEDSIILFQLNLEHTLDDACGWVTVAAYKQYPSKDEYDDKMLKTFGYEVKNPKDNEHYRYINVPFYQNYV